MIDLRTGDGKSGPVIRLLIASRPQDVALIRAAVRGLGEQAGMERSALQDLELCVSEAVSNVIEHAYVNRTDEEVCVEWHTGLHGAVQVAVCDRGVAMDPSHLARADRSILEVDVAREHSLREGGRGLALIKELMDEVSYESGEGVNRLVMIRRVGEE